VAGGPYYGDPESVRLMNANVTTIKNADTFEQQIEMWSSIATPVLEGHLAAVFSDWPDGDSTNRNAISTLWVLAMTMLIQTGKFATNTPGAQSATAGTAGDLYGQLLKDLEAGRMVVLGATRVGRPSATNASNRRWKMSDKNSPDEPEGVGDTFQHGLRK